MKTFKQHSLYEASSSDFSAWGKMSSFPSANKTKEWLDWIIKGDVDDKGKSLPPNKNSNPTPLEGRNIKLAKGKTRGDKPNDCHFIKPIGGKGYSFADTKALFEPMGLKVKKIPYKLNATGSKHSDHSLAFAVSSNQDVYKLEWSNTDWVLFKSGQQMRPTKEKASIAAGGTVLQKVSPLQLRPQNVGIPTNKELTLKQVMSYLRAGVKKLPYPKEHQDFLILMAERCSKLRGWGDIDLSDKDVNKLFDSNGIKKIGKDYGEVLGGICLLTSGFDTVMWPEGTNVKIADLYISKPSHNIVKQFVSVKSGSGSATSWSGFKEVLYQLQAFKGEVGSLASNSAYGPKDTSKKEEALLKILDGIIDNPSWSWPLEIAKQEKTDYIVALSKAMKKPINKITLDNIGKWVTDHKDIKSLGASLQALRDEIGMGGTIADGRLMSALGQGAWDKKKKKYNEIKKVKPEGVVNISVANNLTAHLSKKYKRELKLIISRLNAWQYNADWGRGNTRIIQTVKTFKHMNWKVKMAGNSKEFQNKIAFIKEMNLKSFKNYIVEQEIYPKSYLKNRQLMALVKKHTDPLKFLLAVIDQMNRGTLNLKRIGAASTREVAALWNDFNNKKIPANMMESLQLNEGRKLGQVMWKDDMDFDNPEIHIIGLGVYTLKTLRSNIAMKLEDLAKRLRNDENSSWAWKQITNPKEILHNLVGALYEVEDELSRPASKRKITMMKKKR